MGESHHQMSYDQEAPPMRGLLLFKRISQTLLDLVFPYQCSSCGRVGQAWCDICKHDLEHVTFSPRQTNLDALRVISTGVHDGILRDATHALKYDYVREVADLLADRLSRVVTDAGIKPDVIVPVPLHADRLSVRGYNQAELLAQELARRLACPMDTTSVRRVRFTRSQVGLNAIQRHENVRDAFVAEAGAFSGRYVLLVDDVFTTGATIKACADAIMVADAIQIDAVTVTSASDVGTYDIYPVSA